MRPAAYAVLNVNALQHNLSRVRAYAPHSRIMAVIKANGYGHGLLRVAEALHGVDALAVARVDEAITLRKHGLRHPVTVLEGFTCQEELLLLIQYELHPVIHCIQQIQLLEMMAADISINISLKLDTGMNRLGFSTEEFSEIYQRVQKISVINKPFTLMTHLANADDLQDNKTQQQIELFKKVVASCTGEYSIANSAAILGWKQSINDWIRPGIMLYGVAPFAKNTGQQFGLVPVMSLCSRLIAVKKVIAGETVGYGGSWCSSSDTLMGVIAIGYGDGYPRQAPSGTPVLVNGVRVALIGRVSMDMITVDLANCPKAVPGDPVTLWGEGLPVEEIAAFAETIPYTLLCGITQRVQIVEQ